MAYLSSFDHDLFISYAWHDDRLENAGWISNLRESLAERVESLLGARDERALKVFWDHRDADRTADIQQELLDHIKRTAILVIMLSPQYMASKWCAEELKNFISCNGGIENCRRRIFVVHVLDARDSRPAEIENETGYQFCTFEGDASTTYGFPSRERDDPLYQKELNRLRTDLVRRLKQLADMHSEASTAAPDSPTGSMPADGFTMLLSESNQHLAVRDEVMDFLAASTSPRFHILPDYRYDRAREKHVEQLSQDLNRTRLFVGFLGEHRPEPYPTIEEGYEGLQWHTAQQMGIPSIRWRPDSLDLNQIDDDEHRAALEQCDAALPSAFCDLILQRVRSLLLPKPQIVSPDEKYVVLRAHHDDKELATQVVEQLKQRSIAHDVAFEDEEIEEVTAQDFDGLFFLYGTCAARWLKSEARRCMKLVESLIERGKVVGILNTPPPATLSPHGKERLLFRPRGFRSLTSIDELVAAIDDGGAPA